MQQIVLKDACCRQQRRVVRDRLACGVSTVGDWGVQLTMRLPADTKMRFCDTAAQRGCPSVVARPGTPAGTESTARISCPCRVTPMQMKTSTQKQPNRKKNTNLRVVAEREHDAVLAHDDAKRGSRSNGHGHRARGQRHQRGCRLVRVALHAELYSHHRTQKQTSKQTNRHRHQATPARANCFRRRTRARRQE